MSALSSRLHRGRPAGDAGVVLVFVMLSILVIGLFVSAGLAYAVRTQGHSRGDQDRNTASAAAQAGIDDYVARLNRDDAYYASVDCTNTAVLKPGLASCPATTTVGWQPVDPALPAGPAFHYDVDGSAADTSGTVTITSTGRSSGRTRTLQAVVGKDNASDYLYFTDHESADPKDPIAYPTTMPDGCYNYWYGPSADSRPTALGARSAVSGCSETSFGLGDVLDGSVYTRDTPRMAGSGATLPTFQKGVYTLDPACPLPTAPATPSPWTACDQTHIGANYAQAPTRGEDHGLPDSSVAFSTKPGCQYRGATRVQFTGSTMTVWSRGTTSGTAACGGNSPMGVSVAVPDNKVIYVGSDPSTAAHRCASQEVDGSGSIANGFTGGTLPLGSWRPTATSNTYDDNTLRGDLYCGLGDVYVAGTVTGRVTIAAETDVVVTGDLQVTSRTGSDVIGLVGGVAVQVGHPEVMTVTCNNGGNNCVTTGPTDVSASCAAGRKIDASIVALQGNFSVQDYLTGCAQGALTLNGSIAQKWRGRVGATSGSTTWGYSKDYHYDKRLKLRAPPYFPYWTNAAWTVKRSTELAPQYR